MIKTIRRIFLAFSVLLVSLYVILDAFVLPSSIKTQAITPKPDFTHETVKTTEPTKTPNPTQTPEKEPELTPEPSPTKDRSDYGVGDMTYKDDNVELTITKVEETVNGEFYRYYVADIKVSDVKYIKAAFAKGEFGRNIKDKTSVIAQENSAVFAVSGDYYGSRYSGLVIRNGVLYRDFDEIESLVIMDDGTMLGVTGEEGQGEELLHKGAWQGLTFGPTLVRDGEITGLKADVTYKDNPRIAVGMIEPLHYVFVAVDGRLSEVPGMDGKELAHLMKELGCTFAYNLDGGGSATMWFDSEVINVPCNPDGKQRNISDILYIELLEDGE